MNNKTPEEISMMLRKMHMSSMAEEYMEQMADTNAELMPFEERFNKIVEAEWDARYNKKFQKFLKKAALRYPEASLDDSIYDAERELDTNTIEASNIRYILTSKGSKEVVSEGLLSEATNGASDFDDALKTELNAGLKGTYGNIYKIYNDSISLKGNKEYDLYLFVDENATNTTMGKTFSAGVAVKAYDREPNSLGEFCGSGENLGECIINFRMAYGNENSKIFYHNTYDSTLSDDSYRFFGASEDVENFVCFGSNESPCPKENLLQRHPPSIHCAFNKY